jgi:CheY-like chemotaxis protein
MAPRRLITVIDDDESVRRSLRNSLKQSGFAARVFTSATELLASDALAESGCLILDVRMPEMSGKIRCSGGASSSLPFEIVRRRLQTPRGSLALEATSIHRRY